MYESMPESLMAQTTVSEDTSPEAIMNAASSLSRDLLNRISSTSEPKEVQSLVAKFQVAQTAMSLPLASIGSCHCGKNLRYKGTTEGLLVCCTGDPEHCWSIK